MGVIYFGDLLEDTVTNGVETVRFSKLMLDRAGYRYREELGTLQVSITCLHAKNVPG